MQRVRRQVGEVGDTEFFQGADQHFRTAGGVERVSIGLEFMVAGENIENNRQQHADGRIEKTVKLEMLNVEKSLSLQKYK